LYLPLSLCTKSLVCEIEAAGAASVLL
jgi:hypothetical protein